jgi:hypothetical protein
VLDRAPPRLPACLVDRIMDDTLVEPTAAPSGGPGSAATVRVVVELNHNAESICAKHDPSKYVEYFKGERACTY